MSETTIQQEIERLTTAKTNIISSITSKGGTVPPGSKLDDLPEAIDEIPSGGGSSDDVRFIDYDGTIVASMSLSEAKALDDFPTHPEHEHLISDGWNTTLSEIQAMPDDAKMDIGATYKSENGSTFFRVFKKAGEEITIYFDQSVSDGVEVDWGDGSTPERFSGTSKVAATHTYTNQFFDWITFTPDEGCNFGNPGSVGTGSTFSWFNDADDGNLRDVIYGRVSLKASLYRCAMIETIVYTSDISLSTSYYRNEISNNYALKALVFPRVAYIAGGSFSAYGLRRVSFPGNATNVVSLNSSKVERICVPIGVTDINSVARGTQALTEIYFSDNVVSFGSSSSGGAFNNCCSLRKIKIPPLVTSFPTNCFTSCASLSEIELNSGTASIPGDFIRGTSIREITIPSSVTSIGNDTALADVTYIKFKDRSSMFSQKFLSSANHVGVLDFSESTQVPTLPSATPLTNLKPYTVILVPDSLYDSWTSAQYWTDVSGQIVKVSEYDNSY